MDGRPIAQNRLLMVIGDLHVGGILAAPHEADPPLVVDPDAVLTPAAPFEGLQPIAWRDT